MTLCQDSLVFFRNSLYILFQTDHTKQQASRDLSVRLVDRMSHEWDDTANMLLLQTIFFTYYIAFLNSTVKCHDLGSTSTI